MSLYRVFFFLQKSIVLVVKTEMMRTQQRELFLRLSHKRVDAALQATVETLPCLRFFSKINKGDLSLMYSCVLGV